MQLLTQAKPVNKRRRRWLILALLLVSGVAWWYWPRGDARFVGKWTLSKWGLTPDSWIKTGPIELIEFRRNGSANQSFEGAMDSFPFRWSASRTEIRFGHRKLSTSDQINKLHSSVMKWINDSTEPWMDEANYDIPECSDTSILLHQPETRIYVRLTRFDSAQIPSLAPVDWEALRAKAR